MVLKTIYVVRHGFRSNWVVNASTGEYTHNFPTPTGIPSDPALASHGVEQSNELAKHLLSQTPAIDTIYSSPFYRCLQTLAPTVTSLNSSSSSRPLLVRPDPGIGEFYGLARFDHPSPATLSVLLPHFPDQLDATPAPPTIVPSKNGESPTTLHDRVAYAIDRIIARADAEGKEALLLCTHAAVMICLGRALTGDMPEDIGEADFGCATCAFTRFERVGQGDDRGERWSAERPEDVPDLEWRGKGVQGGWKCVVNGDCGFLKNGEERGWRFSGDESFLRDPDKFNNPAADSTVQSEEKVQRRSSPRL
ncbi:phosphoglycerate mutase-like protein [Myriangium duriaei CBS 260.36]|uniref:Phosphoglycerate mutase-like protein n=1 Tax=Myriangium duriaei CBS 260.36 TaxID=1168546 RepID=A0A9P4MFV6_9PEZI|nr:phosphoglycerate mutase-like protein [Myriangium duriaei CBS 260.36]